MTVTHDHRHAPGEGCAGGHGHHGHGHHHHHGHALPPGGLDRAMGWGVALNVAFVVVEIAAGFWAGSLALVADAGHNAGDVIGLLLAWGASHLARRPPTRRYTWGFRRSTIYAALANAVLLLTACGGLLWEAWRRLQEPAPVAGWIVAAVAAVGVVINAVTAALLARGARGDANVRGAYLHMAADAAVSAGVVVAGALIALTGLAWIDPVVSILVTLAVMVGTWDLFRESVDLALDAVPRGIEPEAVNTLLADIPGVTEVHDLHVWNASTSETSLTVHLVVPDVGRHDAVLRRASADLRSRFGIAHTTIQIEGEESGRECVQRPAETL
jgi:cobalt-zinc-cadmium efflux system protein